MHVWIWTICSIGTIDKIKIILSNNPIKYDTTIKLFYELGEDYIIDYFLIPDNFHNIIKTINDDKDNENRIIINTRLDLFNNSCSNISLNEIIDLVTNIDFPIDKNIFFYSFSISESVEKWPQDCANVV